MSYVFAVANLESCQFRASSLQAMSVASRVMMPSKACLPIFAPSLGVGVLRLGGRVICVHAMWREDCGLESVDSDGKRFHEKLDLSKELFESLKKYVEDSLIVAGEFHIDCVTVIHFSEGELPFVAIGEASKVLYRAWNDQSATGRVKLEGHLIWLRSSPCLLAYAAERQSAKHEILRKLQSWDRTGWTFSEVPEDKRQVAEKEIHQPSGLTKDEACFQSCSFQSEVPPPSWPC